MAEFVCLDVSRGFFGKRERALVVYALRVRQRVRNDHPPESLNHGVTVSVKILCAPLPLFASNWRIASSTNQRLLRAAKACPGRDNNGKNRTARRWGDRRGGVGRWCGSLANSRDTRFAVPRGNPGINRRGRNVDPAGPRCESNERDTMPESVDLSGRHSNG